MTAPKRPSPPALVFKLRTASMIYEYKGGHREGLRSVFVALPDAAARERALVGLQTAHAECLLREGVPAPTAPTLAGAIAALNSMRRTGLLGSSVPAWETIQAYLYAQQEPAQTAPTWKTLVDKAIGVLQLQNVPDGISEHDALIELLGIFDGPGYRAVRDAVVIDLNEISLAQIRSAYAETFGPFPGEITANAICETIEDIGGYADLVRELDVALNGEAGAAKQASLCDLVAQVRRQQPVQILNLADGMRINFRAPDGRRATLHLTAMLLDEEADPNVEGVMLEAIAAYPVAGAGLLAVDPDEIGGAG